MLKTFINGISGSKVLAYKLITVGEASLKFIEHLVTNNYLIDDFWLSQSIKTFEDSTRHPEYLKNNRYEIHQRSWENFPFFFFMWSKNTKYRSLDKHEK